MFLYLAQTAVPSEGKAWGDLVIYQLTGFLIVIMVLCSLWVAVACLGKLFGVLDLKDPATEASKQRTPSPAQATSPHLEASPEILAVVGAALHTVIRGPFKIVSIETSKPEKAP